MSTKATGQDPLSRSLIEEFGLHAKKLGDKIDQSVNQLGGTLLQRAENIYEQTKGVRNLVMNAKDNPARLGCSVVVLLSGLANVYNGNLVAGGISAALGAKELYNQCSDTEGAALQRMLSDINADVDMVRSLEEGQKKSFDVIEGNLTLIHGDVKTLYSKLDEIKNLNLEGIKSLEGVKKQAYEKGLESKMAYRKALELFKESQNHFKTSGKIYEKCSKNFQLIETLATEEDENTPILVKIDSLVKVAKRANEQCVEGKKELECAEEKFSQAMTALGLAMSLKDEALELISKTAQSAEDALKAGIEKAEYTTACQAKVESVQRELQEVKERSDEMMKLLDEMTEDVKNAKAEAAKMLNPSDVFVGIGIGIVLAPIGTMTALATGTAAAYAWHHGTTIAAGAKKAQDFIFGNQEPLPIAMERDELIRVNFQKKSSGLYGAWVKGRQSNTVGTVDINLGKDEKISFGFDLNNQKYPISKEDLFSLYRDITFRLGNGSMEPNQCRNILDQLQKIVVPRGGLHPNVKGFIKEKQAAFSLVKSMLQLCDKLDAIAS